MFESFVIEYTGTTYHVMTGSIDEDVAYNVSLFVVIEPPYSLPTVNSGETLDAKAYMLLTTSQHHDIWLEGEGKLEVHELLYDENGAYTGHRPDFKR